MIMQQIRMRLDAVEMNKESTEIIIDEEFIDINQYMLGLVEKK